MQPNINTAGIYDGFRLLSINETRKILGIRTTSLKKLIENGNIDAVEINGKYKISVLSIENFVNNNCNKKNAPPVLDSNDEKSILDEILNKYI